MVRRPGTVDGADGKAQRLTSQTNVCATHLTSPITGGSAGQGTVGQARLFGLSPTRRQAPGRSLSARLTTRQSLVRTAKMGPTRRWRLAWLTRIEHPSSRVGFMNSPCTRMMRHLPAEKPWHDSHSRRNLTRPVIRHRSYPLSIALLEIDQAAIPPFGIYEAELTRYVIVRNKLRVPVLPYIVFASTTRVLSNP